MPYTIKLDTEVGEIIVDNVEEYVFAKKYLYYSLMNNEVGRIPRSRIRKAFRKFRGSSRWIKIHAKQFKKKGGDEK